MIKIPVLDTIRSAYGFTLSQLGAIIGLIWIPQLIASVGGYLTAIPYYAHIAAGKTSQAAVPEQALMFFGQVIAIVMFAIMAVAVGRQALGLRQGSAIAYFSFGKAELRVFGASIALTLLAGTFLLAMLLLVSMLRGIAGPVGALLSGTASLAGLGAILYAMVRLAYLVVPASLLNEDYGIERSWTLTQGNFWRIIAVSLVCVGPVLLLTIVPTLMALEPLPANMDLSDPQAMAQFQEMQNRALAENMPLRLGIAFALAPFTFGLSLGASVAVYKTLTEQRSDPFPDSGTIE